LDSLRSLVKAHYMKYEHRWERMALLRSIASKYEE
jgi:hypothetical protein